MWRWFLMLLVCVVPISAQTKELDVSPGAGWVDSGVDLQVGDTVRVTASGELQYTNAKQSNGPEGLPRAFTDLIRIMQLNDAGRGALIGRVGTNDAARPFLLGANGSHEAPVAGHLYLAVESIPRGSGRRLVSRQGRTDCPCRCDDSKARRAGAGVSAAPARLAAEEGL